MPPVVHPGRFLKRELMARKLSANRLSLDIGVPSGRVTDILNGRRSINADAAVRLGRYVGNRAQFWLDLQSQLDIATIEPEKGRAIDKRVRPAGHGMWIVARVERKRNPGRLCKGSVGPGFRCAQSGLLAKHNSRASNHRPLTSTASNRTPVYRSGY